MIDQDKPNIFGGKAIKLLKPYTDYTRLTIDLKEGVLKNGDGEALHFGDDYLLVEDNTDDTLIRIYDSHNTLIHEFHFGL
jgi:hypothetical protein